MRPIHVAGRLCPNLRRPELASVGRYRAGIDQTTPLTAPARIAVNDKPYTPPPVIKRESAPVERDGQEEAAGAAQPLAHLETRHLVAPTRLPIL